MSPSWRGKTRRQSDTLLFLFFEFQKKKAHISTIVTDVSIRKDPSGEHADAVDSCASASRADSEVMSASLKVSYGFK